MKGGRQRAGNLNGPGRSNPSPGPSAGNGSRPAAPAPAPAARPPNAWSKPLPRSRTELANTPSTPGPSPTVPPAATATTSAPAIASAARQTYGAAAAAENSPPRNPGNAPTNSKDTAMHVAMRDRFLQLSLGLVGQRVSVTQTDGSVIEGLLHVFTPFSPSFSSSHRNVYVVKDCKCVGTPSKATSDSANGTKTGRGYARVEAEGSTVVIPVEKVSSVLLKSVRLDSVTGATAPSAAAVASTPKNGSPQNAWASNGLFGNKDTGTSGGRANFRTDQDISSGSDRESNDLVAAGSAWTSPSSDADIKGSALPTNSRADAMRGAMDSGNKGRVFGGTSSGGFSSFSGGRGGNNSATNGTLGGNIGEWDQFSANEKLFDVKSSYDENIYTTALDKSKITSSQIQQAERIAKEIEQTDTTNIHVALERGQATQIDEEDLFSGVLRTDPENKLQKEEGPQSKKVDTNDKHKGIEADDSREEARSKPAVRNYADAIRGDVTSPKDSSDVKAEETTSATVRSPGESRNEEHPASTPDNKETEDKDVAPSVSSDHGSTLDAAPLVSSDQGSTLEEAPEPSSTIDVDPTDEGNQTDNTEESMTDEPVPKEAEEEKSAAPDREDESERDDVTPSGDTGAPDEPGADGSEEKKKEEAGAKKTTSKLNANAKAFTFNPSAKTFTPGSISAASGGFAGDSSASGQAPAPAPGHYVEQAPAGVMMGVPAQHQFMQQHHAGPGHIPQPGVMPMMNAQYVRYAPGTQGYSAIVHPQQITAAGPVPVQHYPQGDDSTVDQHGQQQQPSQIATMDSGQTPHQQTSIPYAVPAQNTGNYYPGGVQFPAPGRGHTSPMMGAYHPQMIGPQPVLQAGTPYRAVYGTSHAAIQHQGANGASGIPIGHPHGPRTAYYHNPTGQHGVGMHYPGPGYSGSDDGGEGYRGPGRNGGRGGGGRNNRRRSGKGGRNNGRGYPHHGPENQFHSMQGAGGMPAPGVIPVVRDGQGMEGDASSVEIEQSAVSFGGSSENVDSAIDTAAATPAPASDSGEGGVTPAAT